MKAAGLMFILALVGASCEKKSDPISPGCAHEATVKDLKPLDGCDFVFELSDGSRLIPERRVYIQAPTREDDPIYYFQFVDGQKVKVSYRDTQLLGTCMAGKIVFVTCISSNETGKL